MSFFIPQIFAQKEAEYITNIYQFYKFRGSEEAIINFIRENELMGALLEVVREIRKVFGKEAILELELHRDPEEGWDELFIIIKSSHNAKELIGLEEKLFREWFVHVMNSFYGKLNFTTELL